MKLQNKNVLVTGGAGFIGSHLVDRIIRENPNNLVVVDNLFLGKLTNLNDAKRDFPGLKFFNVDATDFNIMHEIIKTNNIDVVFNLAVVPLPASLEKPEWSFMQNVLMTKVLCELIRKNLFKTLIHCSSSEVYGTALSELMSEEHPIRPHTPYAASKAAADLMVESYYKTFGIDMAIVRPFNNYGPRQNEGSYAGIIPLTLKRIFNNESPVIYGDGKQTRDFIYVTETADAFVRVYESENTRGKTINLASGKEISINKVIDLLLKFSNSKLTVKSCPERIGDVRKHLGDISLARDLIGFQPTVSFEDGIKETVEWYLNYLINQ